MEVTMKVRKNGNKKVICLVCAKSMDSDKLKRHNKIHKDLLSLPEDEVKEELRLRYANERFIQIAACHPVIT